MKKILEINPILKVKKEIILIKIIIIMMII